MNDWNYKRLWRKHDKNFCVEISCHEVEEDTYFNLGRFRWCVYAYIYPKHDLFNKLKDIDDIFSDIALSMPFHRGVSLIERNYDNNHNITSVKIGGDYNHLHDNYFSFLETKEEAAEVFNDAENLINYLKNYK